MPQPLKHAYQNDVLLLNFEKALFKLMRIEGYTEDSLERIRLFADCVFITGKFEGRRDFISAAQQLEMGLNVEKTADSALDNNKATAYNSENGVETPTEKLTRIVATKDRFVDSITARLTGEESDDREDQSNGRPRNRSRG